MGDRIHGTLKDQRTTTSPSQSSAGGISISLNNTSRDLEISVAADDWTNKSGAPSFEIAARVEYISTKDGAAQVQYEELEVGGANDWRVTVTALNGGSVGQYFFVNVGDEISLRVDALQV